MDAVSVLGSCDSPLTPLFREMVPDGHILQKVESLEYQDEMGLSAWVGGRRVLIGNRQLMDAYGVELPSEEWEERYTQNGNRVLYLSNSGQAAAMYILSYKADKRCAGRWSCCATGIWRCVFIPPIPMSQRRKSPGSTTSPRNWWPSSRRLFTEPQPSIWPQGAGAGWPSP